MIVRRKPLGLRLPGVRSEIDALHRISIDVNAEGAQFEAAFQAVAARCLNRQMDELSPNAALAVTFIVCEAIADESDLERCWMGARNAFHCKGIDYAYWTDSLGRTDCRAIASQTKICLADALAHREPPDWNSTAKEIETWMKGAIGIHALLATRLGISAMTAVLRGSAAFWQRLPGFCHAHVLGLQHMAPLPVSSLVRLATGGAQSSPKAETEDVVDSAEFAIDASIAMAAEFDAAADSPIAERISALLSKKSIGGHAKQRREKLEGLLQLHPFLQQSDGHGSLLMAIALHLLVVGTPESASPSMRIVGAYIKDLHTAFSQWPGGLGTTLSTEEEELPQVYQSLIEANPSCRFLQSAIGAFHSFLVSRFGFAPTWVRGRQRDIVVFPNAEVLHEHEVDRLLVEIGTSPVNRRVRQFASAMVRLALDVPVRFSDVLRLRIADVRGSYPAMFVDIRHRSNDPRAKTPATLRTVKIRNEQTAAALGDLKAMRQGETTSTKDRLFGDGFRMPTIKEVTQAYALVNRLIKKVTGVHTIGFHVLRHTSISIDVQRALLERSAVIAWEVFEECSARSGHASPVTCLITYSHLWALPMRHAIDDVLDTLLTVRGVSKWCAVSENALSKRRALKDGTDVLRSALRAAARSIELRSVASGISTLESQVPPAPHRPPGVIEVLLVMEAIGAGMPDARVSENSGLSAETVARVRQAYRSHQKERPVRFKRTQWQQRKWASVLDRVCADPGSEAVRLALRSWRHCSRKGRLDARDSALLDGLLRFLAAAGVPAARLVVRSVEPEGARAKAAVNLVMAIFHASPVVERVPKKKGRVSDYLYVMSAGHAHSTKTAASAATSMRGLDAIFTAATIFSSGDEVT